MESTEAVTKETISLKQYAPEGLLMTLYFDFDSDELTQESIQCLERFINEMGTYYFSELRFDGFADEMGSDNYNYTLSARRAKSVARVFTGAWCKCTFQYKGSREGKTFSGRNEGGNGKSV